MHFERVSPEDYQNQLYQIEGKRRFKSVLQPGVTGDVMDVQKHYCFECTKQLTSVVISFAPDPQF